MKTKKLTEQDKFNNLLLQELNNAKNKKETVYTSILFDEQKAQICINDFKSTFYIENTDELIRRLKENISHNSKTHCWTNVNWTLKRVNYTKTGNLPKKYTDTLKPSELGEFFTTKKEVENYADFLNSKHNLEMAIKTGNKKLAEIFKKEVDFFEQVKENIKTFYIQFFKDENGEILAFFPYEKQGEKTYLSYQHIGQHSDCSAEYTRDLKRATENEYQELKNELINVGYEKIIVI